MKLSQFRLLGFRRPHEVVCEGLGVLESKVMEECWRRGEVSVREIYSSFNEQAAYTTLMTTLDRLYKKGLLDRRKEGRAFHYSPRLTREELEQGVAEDVIDGLFKLGSTRPVLACIVDAVTEHDRELLDELDRLVQEKREALKALKE